MWRKLCWLALLEELVLTEANRWADEIQKHGVTWSTELLFVLFYIFKSADRNTDSWRHVCVGMTLGCIWYIGTMRYSMECMYVVRVAGAWTSRLIDAWCMLGMIS